MATTPEKAKEVLIGFAQQCEATLGTEETTALLERMTQFFKEAPGEVLEIRQLVKTNPDRFNSMLTRKGIKEIKDLIELVESGDIFSAFMQQ